MEGILAETSPADNPLLASVHTREDANALLQADHPAAGILTQPGLVVQRHREMTGVVSRLEQVNKYVILDPCGNHIGYMAEHDGVFQKLSPGQWFRTHRAFTTHVFDKHLQEVLRFHRPFSWTSTQVRVYDALERNSRFSRTGNNNTSESGLTMEAMPIIGEARSLWALQSRKYNLFLAHAPESAQAGPGSISTKPMEGSSELQHQQPRQIGIMPGFVQFAHVEKPFSSLDFPMTSEDGQLMGLVNQSFRGITREIFTSTGAYVFRLDSAGLEQQIRKEDLRSQTSRVDQVDTKVLGEKDPGSTLDQRAVMLGTAVTLNFDYFSRTTTDDGVAFIPIPIPGGGKSVGAGTGTAGGEEVGAVVGGAGRTVGGAAGGTGFSNSTIAGAGTLAGYDAMQRGMEQKSSPTTQDASPQTPQSDSQSPHSVWESQDQKGDVWGQGDSDPWSESGGGGGGGWFQWFWDLFT